MAASSFQILLYIVKWRNSKARYCEKLTIYLAATIGYRLGSAEPEEVAFYMKISEEMKDGKKRGIWESLEKVDAAIASYQLCSNHCRTGLT